MKTPIVPKKIRVTLLLFFLCLFYGYAQVGIGTTAPSAQLEIDEIVANLPALELNPQTTPTGTATGQIAVIGDQLYMYDNTRGKWLSVESAILNFGKENGSDDQYIEYTGDITSASGPRMPLDGTIVYVSMNSSGGQANKPIELYKNGVMVPNNNADPSVDGLMQLISNRFINTDYNLDFDAGDYIQVRASASGGAVNDLSVLLWIKWRQD